ncbi:MAG: S41 family peptidase [Patescibacteria group bacterium]
MIKISKKISSRFPKTALKALIFVLASLVSIGLVAYGFYYLGFNEGLKQTKNIVIDNISNIEEPEETDLDTDFSIFWEAWDRLKAEHPDISSIKDIDLIYGAIKGLTNSIGDPNTTFFTPEDSKKFSEDISGQFSGIGTEIGIREGNLLIVAPLKGSPAEKAGILPEDKILKINGETTAGLSVDEAAKKIRGEVGTTVILTIGRKDVLEEFDVSIIRENIEIPTLDVNMVGEEANIMHIQIYNFNRNLPTIFRKEMLKNALTTPKGIILDFRNNPGGLLDVAVDLAGWFIEDGKLVVSERFTSGSVQEFRAKGVDVLKDIPIVILVNEGSASASEIVAGAIRIQRGAELIGQTTFGKGTVQELQDLSDGSTLKVTIAHWLLPDGTLIEGNGLVPNFVVKITEEDFLGGKDPQFDKALEIIKSKI